MFEFAFSRQNYLLLLVGVVIVILGFALMSGGGSDDPNEFRGDYSITDESIELLQTEFKVDEAIISKLSSVKGQVFPSEGELNTALKSALGAADFDANYYELRSAATIDAAIFSTRRITIAPIVALLGYIFIIYAIMKKPSAATREVTPTQS